MLWDDILSLCYELYHELYHVICIASWLYEYYDKELYTQIMKNMNQDIKIKNKVSYQPPSDSGGSCYVMLWNIMKCFDHNIWWSCALGTYTNGAHMKERYLLFMHHNLVYI